MKIIKTCCLMMVLFVCSGCATIVSKNAQQIPVSSEPDQANLVITDEANKVILSTQTPATVNFKKGEGFFHGKDYILKFSKEGYRDKSILITSEPNNWYLFGNLLTLGIGYLVDPFTGAMWTIDPAKINAVLEKSAIKQVTSEKPALEKAKDKK